MKKALNISLLLTLILFVISAAVKVMHVNPFGLAPALFMLGGISMILTVFIGIGYLFTRIFKD